MIGLAGGAVLKVAGRAVAGMLAGVAAGFAMSQVHGVWGRVEKRIESGRGPKVEGESAGAEPATVKLAEAVVGPLPEDEKARAGTIAHYAMSAVTGAVYEFLAPAVPIAGAGRGLAFGAAVWAVADEVAVPAFGFAAPAWRYPIATHVRALLAHLVYGATLDVSLRLMRRALA